MRSQDKLNDFFMFQSQIRTSDAWYYSLFITDSLVWEKNSAFKFVTLQNSCMFYVIFITASNINHLIQEQYLKEII